MDFLQSFLKDLPKPEYRSGIRRLLLRLQQQRDRLQGEVNRAMDRLELSGVLEDMGGTLREIRVRSRMENIDDHSLYVYQQAYLEISIRLEDMLAYETYIHQPERIDELHAMRIAAKRLRYTMEIFEPLYDDEFSQLIKDIRKIQTLLGDIHDCDVWVDYLPQFLEEEKQRTLEYYGHTRAFKRLITGLIYLQEQRQKKRDEIYEGFLKFWDQLQAQDFSDGLLKLISKPLAEASTDSS
jgi:CHAD domain-containing protein